MSNSIALVVDRSGSMHPFRNEVINLYNSTRATIKSQQDDARISLLYFGGGTVSVIFKNILVKDLKELDPNSYVPNGDTPLFDGVEEAIETVENKVPENTSFLVMVITDGEENSSKMKPADFKKLIQKKQATDFWTFAFMVPKDYASKFQRLSGIPTGNIRVWDDMKDADTAANTGLVAYLEARKSGKKSVKNFFTTDLSKVKKSDIKKLKNIAKEVKVLSVEKESPIKEFVESKGLIFIKGSGFYQLTKRETVQDYKEMLLMEKGKKEVLDGARKLLGLPEAGDISVVPGNHENFDIFVQSTSQNRKLVRGTKLIYKK